MSTIRMKKAEQPPKKGDHEPATIRYSGPIWKAIGGLGKFDFSETGGLSNCRGTHSWKRSEARLIPLESFWSCFWSNPLWCLNPWVCLQWFLFTSQWDKHGYTPFGEAIYTGFLLGGHPDGNPRSSPVSKNLHFKAVIICNPKISLEHHHCP